MATISLTIPDAIAVRVLDAMAYGNGYTDTVTDMNGDPLPNPITKMQFAKNVLKGWIKSNVVAYESVKAAENAREVAIEAATAEITIGD